MTVPTRSPRQLSVVNTTSMRVNIPDTSATTSSGNPNASTTMAIVTIPPPGTPPAPVVNSSEIRITLSKVGISTSLASHYPSELSGGQQQRVAIARAIASNPEIVYFDEPTSALDPELAAEVISIMKMLADEGMTMLVVTHSMELARSVSKQVVFLDHGVVIERGNADEFFSNPKEARVRDFLSLERV